MSTKLFIPSSAIYTVAAIASISTPVFAQNIVPSAETNTLVNQNNNLYTITGGMVTPDNLNGFHKFDIFNLDSGEIANFWMQQDLRNLFIGVNGGDPSIINGLIELTGSDANFFFANPAGIVFGQGAAFNLPADLTVTTANRIGFGEDSWFDVLGANGYSALLGDPTGFAFDALEPSAIINEGDIYLENGSLSFYGGGVAHTGSLKAEKVMIQSVDGQTTARILPEGSLIGIEIDITPEEPANISTSNFSELNQSQSTSQKTLLQTNSGDVEFSTIISGEIDTLSGSEIGGDIKILGEAVLLNENANINALGELGGGDINIGGSFQGTGDLENSQFTLVEENVAISADALTSGDGGDIIIWADNRTDFFGSLSSRGGEVSGNGGFAEISGKNELFYRGNADLGSKNGEIGTLLFDPVDIEISNQATATVLESDIENGITTNLIFEATNDIIFETLDDNNLVFPTSNVDIVFAANSDGIDGGNISMSENIFFKAASSAGSTQGRSITFSGNNISLGDFDTNSGISGTPGIGNPAPGGSIIINATGNITTGNLDVSADSDQTNSPRIPNTGSSGSLTIATNGGNITTGRLSVNAAEGSPGDITLQASGNILVDGNIEAGTVFAEGGSGGAINLASDTGSIQVNGLIGSTTGNNSFTGEISIGGEITLNAFTDLSVSAGVSSRAVQFSNAASSQSGNLTFISQTGNISITEDIFTQGNTTVGTGGAITFNVPNGSLNVENVTSSGFNSGNIILTARDNLSSGQLLAISASDGTNGDVSVTSSNGSIDISSNIGTFSETTSISRSAGGNITLSASENINFSGCGTTSNAAGVTTGVCVETFGGDINLISENGGISITEGYLNAGISQPGVASGNITVIASQDIVLTDVDTGVDYDDPFTPNQSTENAGDITIESINGSVSLRANDDTNNRGQIFVSSANGNSGGITINAATDISIDAHIRSEAGQNNNASGGAVSLTATNGDLTIQNISSTGFNSDNINLTATGNITAGTLISNPNFGNAGNITVNAGNNLTLTGTDDPASVFNGVVSNFSNAVSSSGIDLTAGGNITLNCPYNCLRVGADPNNLALTDSLPGSIFLNAGGGIKLENIFTGDTSSFTDSLPLFIDASNQLGDGGQISIQAVDDVQVGTMSVSSFGVGSSAGSIEITSTEGSVNTAFPELGDTVLAGRILGTNIESSQSDAGSLIINANESITTGFLRFWGTQDGGTVNLISRNGGTIDVTAGDLELFTTGDGDAGTALIKTDGAINLGAINATSVSGNGGNLTFNSNSVNFLENVRTSGVLQIENDGDTVLSSDSNVEFEIDTLRLSSNSGNARLDSNLVVNNGNVDILAELDIDLAGNITTNGGNINLLSNNGNIATQNLDASNAGGVGGNVSLNALGNPQTVIETGDINTSGDTGGDIEIFSVEGISAGQIISRGIVGDGGDVTIDPNSVDIVFIDAQGGGLGSGGSVDITVTGLFQATGAFVDDTGLLSSISTFGGAGSGPITIRHNGGDLFIPFIVGDPSINGTLGALNSGDFTIDTFRVFPGSFFLGNISIITSDRLPNALDNAIDDTLPKIQEEVEAKDKGFFIDEFFTRQFESYFTGNELANDIRIKSINEIQDTLAYIESVTGVRPALVYGLFQPQNIRLNCTITQESTQGILEPELKDSCVQDPRKFDEQPDDILTLITVTKNEEIKFTIVPGAERGIIKAKTTQLRKTLKVDETTSDIVRNFDDEFRKLSAQFHEWLIENLNPEIRQKENIDNLTFILDDVLRSVPLAAMGQETNDCLEVEMVLDQCLLDFIITRQSVGLMPSMSLTETNYQPLTSLSLRVAGASQVADPIDEQALLSFVPSGLRRFEELWQEIGEDISTDAELIDSFMTLPTNVESSFTIPKVGDRQREAPMGIVHWSTHANFDKETGTYISFNPDRTGTDNGRLELDHIRKMGLGNVNLLVLDACETAIDVDEFIGEVNEDGLRIERLILTPQQSAELGFAGFAHKAETNSVLGTLWRVGDRASSIFMSRFYSSYGQFQDIKTDNYTNQLIKAEALRQTQEDLLEGRVYIENSEALWQREEENHVNILLNLNISASNGGEELNDKKQLLSEREKFDLSDPIYWSAFTMVGSPW